MYTIICWSQEAVPYLWQLLAFVLFAAIKTPAPVQMKRVSNSENFASGFAFYLRSAPMETETKGIDFITEWRQFFRT
jgi:hypothetical protein